MKKKVTTDIKHRTVGNTNMIRNHSFGRNNESKNIKMKFVKQT